MDSRTNKGKMSIEETRKPRVKGQAQKEKMRTRYASFKWLNIHWGQRKNVQVLTCKTFMRYHKLSKMNLESQKIQNK